MSSWSSTKLPDYGTEPTATRIVHHKPHEQGTDVFGYPDEALMDEANANIELQHRTSHMNGNEGMTTRSDALVQPWWPTADLQLAQLIHLMNKSYIHISATISLLLRVRVTRFTVIPALFSPVFMHTLPNPNTLEYANIVYIFDLLLAIVASTRSNVVTAVL